MKHTMTDEKWDGLAEKNAQHRAHMHIESGHVEQIAKAFDGIPAERALSFLFELAEKARQENKPKRALTILEAVKLIDRTTGAETTLIEGDTISSDGSETAFVYVERRTPKDIFESPIED